jgi:tRNA wybutosine-synthesizing protein 4
LLGCYASLAQVLTVISDSLPFHCLAKKTDPDVLYVDIDYPELMAKKATIIAQTPELHSLLADPQHHSTPVNHIHYQSKQYLALGCDLRDLKTLQQLFELHGLVETAIFFTSEESLIYMPCESVDALIQWAANLPDGNS